MVSMEEAMTAEGVGNDETHHIWYCAPSVPSFNPQHNVECAVVSTSSSSYQQQQQQPVEEEEAELEDFFAQWM
jgi:hypothetical protein